MGVLNIFNSSNTFWNKIETYDYLDEQGKKKLKMNISKKHTRDIDIVHGGAICALIDKSIKCFLLNNNLYNKMYITNSNVFFHKPGSGIFLTADCKIEGESIRKKVLNCFVYDSNENYIANCLVVIEKKKKTKREVKSKSLLEFTGEELNRTLPSRLIENDPRQPFREYMSIERNIWKKGICEMVIKIAEDNLEPNGSVPHSIFMMLTDMSSGQVIRTIIPSTSIGLTTSLSTNILNYKFNFDKLFVRAWSMNEGKIINTKTAIFDEDYQHIAVGTSTYYIKSQS